MFGLFARGTRFGTTTWLKNTVNTPCWSIFGSINKCIWVFGCYFVCVCQKERDRYEIERVKCVSIHSLDSLYLPDVYTCTCWSSGILGLGISFRVSVPYAVVLASRGMCPSWSRVKCSRTLRNAPSVEVWQWTQILEGRIHGSRDQWIANDANEFMTVRPSVDLSIVRVL